MRKSLVSVGTLVAIAAPVAVVVSCNNGEDGKSSTTTNKTTSQGYVQTRPDSDYPQMNPNIYKNLDNNPDYIALNFYKSKSKAYFAELYKKNYNKPFQNQWSGNVIYFDWTIDGLGVIFMNLHELYDYAHLVSPNFFPYN